MNLEKTAASAPFHHNSSAPRGDDLGLASAGDPTAAPPTPARAPSRFGRRAALVGCAAALVTCFATGCEKKQKGPVMPTEAKGAVPELGAAVQRVQAAVAAKNAAALRAEIDPELALRIDTSFTHAAARSVDQLAISQRGASQVKEANALHLKREGIAEILTRGLAKEKDCAFAGQVLMRTPRWPTKQREGWEFVVESGKLVGHVYDAYVPCKSGFSMEVRFAQKKASPDWKVVAATELPFGVQKPVPPPKAIWD